MPVVAAQAPVRRGHGCSAQASECFPSAPVVEDRTSTKPVQSGAGGLQAQCYPRIYALLPWRATRERTVKARSFASGDHESRAGGTVHHRHFLHHAAAGGGKPGEAHVALYRWGEALRCAAK